MTAAAGHQHVGQEPRLAEDGAGLRQEGRRDHGHAGTAVVEDVQIVLAAQQGVDGHGDGADLDGAPEGAQELGAVETDQEDAILHLHAELEEGVAGAVGKVCHIPIGEGALLAEEGGSLVAALSEVTIDEVGGHVELRGQRLGGVHTRPRLGVITSGTGFLLSGQPHVLEVQGLAVDAAPGRGDPVGEHVQARPRAA